MKQEVSYRSPLLPVRAIQSYRAHGRLIRQTAADKPFLHDSLDSTGDTGLSGHPKKDMCIRSVVQKQSGAHQILFPECSVEGAGVLLASPGGGVRDFVCILKEGAFDLVTQCPSGYSTPLKGIYRKSLRSLKITHLKKESQVIPVKVQGDFYLVNAIPPIVALHDSLKEKLPTVRVDPQRGAAGRVVDVKPASLPGTVEDGPVTVPVKALLPGVHRTILSGHSRGVGVEGGVGVIAVLPTPIIPTGVAIPVHIRQVRTVTVLVNAIVGGLGGTFVDRGVRIVAVTTTRDEIIPIFVGVFGGAPVIIAGVLRGGIGGGCAGQK
jgi:hypothetical protein